MKKIILSLAIVGIVGAVVIGATTAYFSDIAVSGDNTFTAGWMDLHINAPQYVIWTMPNMAPGDSVSATLGMKNIGSLTGDLYAEISFVDADRTDDSYIEKTAEEVAARLIVTNIAWIDNTNPVPGLDLLSYVTDVNGNDLQDLQDLQSALTAGKLGTLIAGEDASLAMTVKFDENAGNDFQGEGVGMTITASLHQVGH
jgi:predicted ribosomally synthesized peptide with SipW-like signal peptide